MDLKIIPVVQVIIAAALMVFISNNFVGFNFYLSLGKAIALCLIISAMVIGVLAIFNFKKNQTTVDPSRPENVSTIVDSGVYRYSRNPMYLALTLLLFAFGFYLSNYLCFLIIPVFISYITEFQIKPEERALTKLFSQDYLNYRAKVRRWL